MFKLMCTAAFVIGASTSAFATTLGLNTLFETKTVQLLFGGTPLSDSRSLIDYKDGTLLLSQGLQPADGSPKLNSLLTYDGTSLSTFLDAGTSGFPASQIVLGAGGTSIIGRVPGGSDIVRVQPMGAVTTEFADFDQIGPVEVRPVSGFVETAAGIVFGGIQRPTGSTGNSFNGLNIVLDDGVTPIVIATKGAALLGEPNKTIRGVSFFDGSANDAGQVIFTATLEGSAVNQATDPTTGFPTSNTNGLILRDGADLKLIVEGGSPTPDGTQVFSQFLGSQEIDENGRVLFAARTYNPTTQAFEIAIFMYADNAVTKLIAPGDPVPGDTSGSVIDRVNFSSFSFGDDGTLLLGMSATGGDLDGQSLFVTQTTDGTQEIVIRTGQSIGAGDTIFTFVSAFIQDKDTLFFDVQSPNSLFIDPNDVTLSTQTRTRYIVETTRSSLNVVPVPAGLPLLLTGFAGLYWMRRRRAA